MDDIRYQAFISYARDDNQPSLAAPVENGRRLGWVEVFLYEQKTLLTRHIRRDNRCGQRAVPIFIDYRELRVGHLLTPEIERALAASRTFVPILSANWFDSDWCLREFEQFLATHPDGMARVFPVEMDQIDPTDLAPAARRAWERLRGCTPLRFWFEDDHGERVVRGFPTPDPTDRTYWVLHGQLAQQIAAKVAAATDPPPDPPPAPAADPAADPAPAPAGTAARPPLVVVHGGSDDAGAVRAVARCLLRHHGIAYSIPDAALPDSRAGKSFEALRDDLEETLAECTAVLFVYQDGPADQLKERLRQCRKALVKVRRSGPLPPIALCHAGTDDLLEVPPGLLIHPGSGGDNCLDAFVAALAARPAP